MWWENELHPISKKKKSACICFKKLVEGGGRYFPPFLGVKLHCFKVRRRPWQFLVKLLNSLNRKGNMTRIQ